MRDPEQNSKKKIAQKKKIVTVSGGDIVSVSLTLIGISKGQKLSYK
jgi:hypothetical protein